MDGCGRSRTRRLRQAVITPAVRPPIAATATTTIIKMSAAFLLAEHTTGESEKCRGTDGRGDADGHPKDHTVPVETSQGRLRGRRRDHRWQPSTVGQHRTRPSRILDAQRPNPDVIFTPDSRFGDELGPGRIVAKSRAESARRDAQSAFSSETRGDPRAQRRIGVLSRGDTTGKCCPSARRRRKESATNRKANVNNAPSSVPARYDSKR